MPNLDSSLVSNKSILINGLKRLFGVFRWGVTNGFVFCLNLPGNHQQAF